MMGQIALQLWPYHFAFRRILGIYKPHRIWSGIRSTAFVKLWRRRLALAQNRGWSGREMGIAGRTSHTGSFGSGRAVVPTLRAHYVAGVPGHYEPMSTSVNKTLNLPMALVEPCIMDHRSSSLNEYWTRSHAPWP